MMSNTSKSDVASAKTESSAPLIQLFLATLFSLLFIITPATNADDHDAPRPVGTIVSFTLTEGGTSTFDIVAYFTDGDGDTLTYTVISDNTPTVTAEISDSVVTITANKVGRAMITVTASSLADRAEQTFEVNVNPVITDLRAFITTWETTRVGETITIPIVSGNPYYKIECYNGDLGINIRGNGICDYETPGIHTVVITGAFSRIHFNNGGDKDKIRSVAQWGNNVWASMEGAFHGASDFDVTAADAPNLLRVINMGSMFEGASRFTGTNTDMNSWDVSLATNMERMFHNAGQFNGDISNWDVGEVTSFWRTFNYATIFNQDISRWDVSKVTNMGNMFSGASAFNQDISGWRFDALNYLYRTFAYATAFDQNLGDWDVSRVSGLGGMFEGVTLSTANYEKLLIGWAAQRLLPGKTLDFGRSQLCSSAAHIAKQSIETDDGWTINDGGVSPSCPQQPPVITSDGGGDTATISVVENRRFVTTVRATDLENDAITYTLSGGADQHLFRLVLGLTSAVLEFSTAPDFETPASAAGSNDYIVIVTASDGNFSDIQTLTITVTNKYEAPKITLNGGRDYPLPIDENTKFVTTVTATVDATGTLTYSLAPEYGYRLFEITPQGVLTFKNACIPDYEKPRDDECEIRLGIGQAYWVRVSVADGTGAFNQILVKVETLDVENELPTKISLSAIIVDENAEAGTVIGTLSKTGGISGSSNHYTLFDGRGGADNAAFILEGTILKIRSTPVPGKSSYAIRIKLNDGVNDYLKIFTVTVANETQFVTTWRITDDDKSITIPTTGRNYSYMVSWGDGNADTNQTGDATHEYVTAGNYEVRISGTFPMIYFKDSPSDLPNTKKIRSIDQWGTGAWTSMENAFAGAVNLVVNATDAPDLSGVTSMRGMFKGVNSLRDVGGNMNNWKTGSVTDMSSMFHSVKDFDQDIGDWEVSRVSFMEFMFLGAESFNQDISRWDVSSGSSMGGMFDEATAFSQNLGRWYITPATLTLDYADVSGSEVATFTAQNAFLISQLPAYTLSGADASAFTLNAGVLTVNDAPTRPRYQITIASTGEFGTDNSLAFTINVDVSPPVITASTDTVIATIGTPISEVTIDSSAGGAVTRYVINPNLNADTGLDFSTATGTISGTPTKTQIETIYAITAINASGMDTVTLTITVTNVNEAPMATNTIIVPVLTVGAMHSLGLGDYFIDEDGDRLTYTVEFTPTGIVTVSPTITDGTTTITASGAGIATIAVTATDGEFSATQTFTVIVRTPRSDDQFITTWRVTDDDKSITIPTTDGNYSYTVIWGDGNADRTNYTGDATYEYDKAGDYEVRISGTFPRIYFNDSGDKSKIYSIEQWGTGAWTSMENAFYGAGNLVVNATDVPDLSGVVSMRQMFQGAARLRDVGGNMNNWKTGRVTDMSGMFSAASAFDQDIGDWDVSRVMNMSYMFYHASSFNQDIGHWTVTSVINMTQMFLYADRFNQDIGGWEVSRVMNMSYMFYHASSFNQDISRWDVSSVTDMEVMFSFATAFSQNLGRWYITTAALTLDYADVSGSEVATFTAQNAFLSGHRPAYTLSGADADAFTLNAGVLTVNDAPTRPRYQITIASTGEFGTDNSLAFTINVEGVPRPVITASTDTVIATIGTPISEVTIDSSAGGAVTRYVINPNLKADTGLDFDTATGTISGTPTKTQTETIYAITAINASGMDTATITITVNAVTNTAPTGLPTISGIPIQGQELTVVTTAIADADGLGTFSYQWQAGGNDIAGVTSATFALTQAQGGDIITVKVSYTDGRGNDETLTSVTYIKVLIQATPEITTEPMSTASPEIIIAGRATEGLIVKLFNNGEGAGTTTASVVSGIWEISVPLSRGTNSFTAKSVFQEIESEHSEEVVVGHFTLDVDGGGNKDVHDLIMIQRYFLGYPHGFAQGLGIAADDDSILRNIEGLLTVGEQGLDVDGSEKETVHDLIMIHRYLLGHTELTKGLRRVKADDASVLRNIKIIHPKP